MYYSEIDSDIRLNEPKVHQRIISKWKASLGYLFRLIEENDYRIEASILSAYVRGM